MRDARWAFQQWDIHYIAASLAIAFGAASFQVV
jgi:hypothetical protein